ncbi:MAG: sulfatase-like hydrolase/transferase [Flavobacterium sp.]|nr:sulfatase-like hydrolase/transferase [Flavobacterium sp.]MBP8156788.1 sulfatase-like hydrolase/transferase [Flavobacterium sp.]
MVGVAVFLILNFLLFIPRYVFNTKTAAFLPIKEFFPKGKLRIQPLFTRFNEDVFRLNWEYAFIFLVLYLGKNQIPIGYAKGIVGVLYLFTLLLFFYHNTIYAIYKSYPSLRVDYRLIVQGVQIALSGFKGYFFLGCIAFISLCYFVILGNFYIVEVLYSDSFLLPIGFALIVLTGILYSLYKKVNPFQFKKEFEFEIQHFATIQWSIALLSSNRFFGVKSKEELTQIPNLIADTIIKVPENLALKSKPNVYFIAIESYGAILYENETYAEKYKTLIRKLEQKLESRNLKSATTLSETTVTGGTSWVSFSSFLKGIKIKNDFTYRYLLNHQKECKTQSVFSILKAFGYDTYLVAGIGGFESLTIEWEKILSFLGTEKAIKYADLEYKGATFNFGPSAPDQYLLNKARNLMEEKSNGKPFAFFVETINSHYNFDTPTQLLSNWEDCQTARREDFKPLQNLSEQVLENYFKAIEYQLNNLEDFISNDNESDSIYVVFGDHQPPLITHSKNSYKTPIHVISKEKKLVEQLIEKGFDYGLLTELGANKFNFSHADFKKVFVGLFINTYSQ